MFRDRSRTRFFISGLLFSLLMIVLAACGGTATGNNGTELDNAEREVKHAMGTTKVPAHPQRVVVLDTGELDNVIALGITPVGAVEAVQGQGYLSYLKDKTSTITSVGTISQPNLTKIASLDPDLILSSKMRHADIYNQLSEIAPTVFTEDVGYVWKENLKLQAQALNKSAEADALMKKYDERVAQFKQKMGTSLATTKVSVVRVLSDHIRLIQHQMFVGTILKDLGLPRPASQDVEGKFAKVTSLEKASDLDGDVIFVMFYGDTQAKYQQLLSNPQFQQLNAVKNNKLYQVSDDIWMLGIGIGGANKVLDEINQYLVK